MKSQTTPSEIASVVRSCPTVTATTAAGADVSLDRRRDGAQQRERLEVDPDQLDLRRLAGAT